MLGKKIPVISYAEEYRHCGACVQECPEGGEVRERICLTAILLYK